MGFLSKIGKKIDKWCGKAEKAIDDGLDRISDAVDHLTHGRGHHAKAAQRSSHEDNEMSPRRSDLAEETVPALQPEPATSVVSADPIV